MDPDAPQLRVERPLHLRPLAVALVALGGIAGTGTRIAAGSIWPTAAGHWPAATFVVNLIGAFILGAALERLARAGTDTGWRQRLRLLIGTGFCGGLTTYSTLAVETDQLIRGDHPAIAVAYLAASVVAGLLTAAAGIRVAMGKAAA